MSENDEDFVEVIKRGLDQDKIKDKWKGEFSGRQKFSERVEKRIAKGSRGHLPQQGGEPVGAGFPHAPENTRE